MQTLDQLTKAAQREAKRIADEVREHEERERERRLRTYFRQLARLKAETLSMYTALPAVEPFHASRARWRVLEGSNQSSKTSGGAVEIARCVCNLDPYKKYPDHGRALAIGLDELHLAEPMVEKLIRPGAFSIIKDEHTRQWRFLKSDPNDPTRLHPYDAAYREKWRDSPPILPPRLIKSIAWKDKKSGIAAKIHMKTGWTIEFRSSKADPKQGDQNHLGWIDEVIQNEGHFNEMARSFMRHNGVGIWTATPQDINEKLVEIRSRAETDDDNLVISLSIEDNFAIDAAAKKSYFDILSEEEQEVRYFGTPALVGRRIYRYDPMGIHGCEPFDNGIPEGWTRYCVLDPGAQYCGTLFAAVDPDEEHVWVYDGTVIRNSDAFRWADEVAKRQGAHKFEAFIIDQQMGKQTHIGGTKNVAQQYWAALVERKIQPKSKGPLHGFMMGVNDVRAREEALVGWMRIRDDGPFEGTPKLQIVRGCFPKLDKQIHHAHYDRKDPKKRFKPKQEDALVCLEYLAGFDPHYQEPERLDEDENDPFMKLVLRKQAQIKRQKTSVGWNMH